MNCHKCDYNAKSEERLKTHMLFEHQFYMPNCSTDVAYQANNDFVRMRETRERWRNELSVTREWITREKTTKDGRTYCMIFYNHLRDLEKFMKSCDCRIRGNILYMTVLKHRSGVRDKREFKTDNEHIMNYLSRFINLINLERRMDKEGIMF